MLKWVKNGVSEQSRGIREHSFPNSAILLRFHRQLAAACVYFHTPQVLWFLHLHIVIGSESRQIVVVINQKAISGN